MLKSSGREEFRGEWVMAGIVMGGDEVVTVKGGYSESLMGGGPGKEVKRRKESE